MVVLRRPVIRGVNSAGTVSAFFEDGVRVDDPSLQPSLASYAVFAADSGRVEVFRPSPFRNEILDRKGGVWQGKTCKLYRRNILDDLAEHCAYQSVINLCLCWLINY